ncbi:hypothetical protein KXD97_10005 [Mycobacterium sp. SMC-8]|uniref:hypothetical protein n=1 Tax=Mycobacterium sp. SMC-8 TaxID=2857060 RepID=UPI0021B3D915|nr:hypothetical protein [Mycobacterium sp. SMC-8]UXA14076.1 hypothetical protein KXD97_10005 [Mycobacterium sp. SMC-8]
MKDQFKRGRGTPLKRALREVMARDGESIEVLNYRITVGPRTHLGESLYMPEWLTVDVPGYDEPDLTVRIELRNQTPRIVAISLVAGENSREIRPIDFRDSDLESFIRLYEIFVYEVVYDETMDQVSISAATDDHGELASIIRKDIERRRSGKRVINTAFLQQVATVYRDNIEHAPTEAVSRTFGVKHRQATDYVKQARERGLLPPTKQGRARA